MDFKFNFFPLHRQLLYTEKMTLEEFGLPEAVQDKLYELYVTTKQPAIGDIYSVVDVFNEVFYLLTSIYADPSAAEHVGQYLSRDLHIFPKKEPKNDPVSGYPVYDHEYDDQRNYARLYVFTFVWLILRIHQNLPKHVRFFLVALEKQINDHNPYYNSFRTFINGQGLKVDISLEPCPDLSGLTSEVTTEDWIEETKDFDREIVAEIVHRFKDLNGQFKAIDEIRKALLESPEPSEPLYQSRSRLTGKRRADEKYLDSLTLETYNTDQKREEQKREIEKTKDERIKELEAQVKELKKEKQDAESDRDHWKIEHDHLVRIFNERNRRLETQKVPPEFKQLPGSEIIQQLINSGVIRVLYRQGNSNSEDILYKWEGSKKLFGYFVERVADELSLRKSGKSGNIIWEPFMQAFYESEDLRHEAASAISAMKKKGALMPDGADKIEDAIEHANAMASHYKD